MKKKINWEFSLGFYPGIVLGFRSYAMDDRNSHVFYLPFFDACVTIFNEDYEQTK